MQDGRETDPAERWAGAGHSSDSDSARAAHEAVAAAITGEDPRLVVVSASPRHDLDALAGAAQEAAGPAALIGCSGGSGVSAFAVGGEGFAVATAFADLEEGGSRSAGEEAARCLDGIDPELPHRALVLLPDGLAGDPQEVVRGAYSVAGAAVSLAGGCAGGQIHAGRTGSGTVVAAALGSTARFGVGVRHGWRPRGDPLLVTASEGKRLLTLNDRPALDVYLERHRIRDEAEFGLIALLHPFGVAAARGRENQVRAVVGADFEARTLSCNSEVPAGTLIWPMTGEPEQVARATTLACHEALAGLAGRPPRGLLALDSVARAGVSDARARIAVASGGAPFAILRTSGEIARTRGSLGFHSHALAVLAIG